MSGKRRDIHPVWRVSRSEGDFLIVRSPTHGIVGTADDLPMALRIIRNYTNGKGGRYVFESG